MSLLRPLRHARFWWKLRRLRPRWRAIEDADGFDAAHGTDTTGQDVRRNYTAVPVRAFRRIVAALLETALAAR